MARDDGSGVDPVVKETTNVPEYGLVIEPSGLSTK
jgi:hypothetical protein